MAVMITAILATYRCLRWDTFKVSFPGCSPSGFVMFIWHCF